ncbi:crossover junction endodeoxyribonuclease RuvC [Bacillus sp. FJAT-51639]|uniref:Crossover junction endodeoxyribonuclease RuvC n=1 Tax=Bacillus bruguierae TaxID=3127667 RepID=A0ABU8FH49_9BACI
MYDLDYYIVLYVNASKKAWNMSEEDYMKYPDFRAFGIAVTDEMRNEVLDKFASVVESVKKQPPRLNVERWMFNNFKTACAQSLSDEEYEEIQTQVNRVKRSSLSDVKKAPYIGTKKPSAHSLSTRHLVAQPGISVIDVINRMPLLIDVSHVKTKSTEPIALRTKHIESWAHLFIRKYAPYDLIVREGFASKIPHTNYTVFSAWNAVDRALNDFGLKVDDSIGQASVKKKLLGKGRAEKEEVEAGVRRYVEWGEFKTSDESDACAIGLAYLLDKGIIKE